MPIKRRYDKLTTAGDRTLSKLIETQAEFRQLADERLEEARELLTLKKWGGAYDI